MRRSRRYLTGFEGRNASYVFGHKHQCMECMTLAEAKKSIRVADEIIYELVLAQKRMKKGKNERAGKT